jgi:hypothetical protein
MMERNQKAEATGYAHPTQDLFMENGAQASAPGQSSGALMSGAVPHTTHMRGVGRLSKQNYRVLSYI